MDTLPFADSIMHNMALAKTLAASLPSTADKQRVLLWLNKLSKPPTDRKEHLRKNDFMRRLIVDLQLGELMQPFTNPPPPGPLPELHQAMTGLASPPNASLGFQGQIDTTAGHWQASEHNRPLLYKNSPDGGAFLATQPIPVRGAFCYIAVLTKK